MFSTHEGWQYAYNRYTFILVRRKWDGEGGIAGESQTKVFMRRHNLSFMMWGICMAWLNSSLCTADPLQTRGSLPSAVTEARKPPQLNPMLATSL